MEAPPDLEAIRRRFPALGGDWALLENAGGSQVPRQVADAIRDYMLESYVQLGAGHPMSDIATATVDRAHAFVNELMGGSEAGSVILGPSTTQLCHLLAECIAPSLRPGDEIVLAESGHEANIGPWLRLAGRGATIRWWKCDPSTGECTADELDRLLGPRTRIVAFPHVSNLLGGIADLPAILARIHAVGARAVVDGVAFAPHRLMEVGAWNVDWYVYSTYKVFGPHMAALYGRHDAIAELEGPNHFFVPRDRVPYKFELGGVNHEGCAALLALGGYLSFLAGARSEALPDRATIAAAWARMTELEAPLQSRLLEALRGSPEIRVVGPLDASVDRRVPTVSLLVAGRRPSEVVAAAHANQIAIRHGHMYSHRLCTAMGIDPDQGVVRVSAVHYNTIDEIEFAASVIAAG